MSWSYPVLAPVSRSCPEPKGRLSTRYSPVRHFTRHPKVAFSYDLHVLSTPPAFVLSQNQTLQLKLGEARRASKRDRGHEILDAKTRTPSHRRGMCPWYTHRHPAPRPKPRTPGDGVFIRGISSSSVRPSIPSGSAGPHAIQFSRSGQSLAEIVWISRDNADTCAPPTGSGRRNLRKRHVGVKGIAPMCQQPMSNSSLKT